jgi:nitroreductase
LRTALHNAVAVHSPAPDLEFPATYSGKYQQRRRDTGWQLYDAVGVTKGDRAASTAQMMRNFDLFDAPHCAIVSSPVELGGYGAMDCGGFVTGFMLAARAHGIDTIAQAAVASYAPLLHQMLEIPVTRSILCAISFGYGDHDHPANSFRTHRADVDSIIDWRD